MPLLYQPGTAWYYSAGVDIQGVIVERLSGMSFGTFLQTRIFTPLGMTDTGFYVPAEDYDRLSDVFGYHPRTKQFGPYRVPGTAFKQETVAMESGGGGWFPLSGITPGFAKCWQMTVPIAGAIVKN